jgi:ATP-dependent DNA helicase RecG
MLDLSTRTETVYLPEISAQRLAETLVALANGGGGRIVLGMDDGGRVVSVPGMDEIGELVRQAERLCDPAVPTGNWDSVEVEGYGQVFSLFVPRSRSIHRTPGGVLLRSPNGNERVQGVALGELLAAKGALRLEGGLPDADRDDLDPEVIGEFVQRWEGRHQHRIERPVDDLLLELGALERDGRQPTLAGMLLFGRRPTDFLSQARLVFVKFSGTTPGSGPTVSAAGFGLPGYERRVDIGGPLPRMLEQAWQVVWESMHVGAVVRGLQREDLPDYPPFAVREALVNAVAHRDYAVAGKSIEVRMFSDRLEVISPGGLAGHMTVDNLVDEHYSRNPRLVEGLLEWGYIEGLGLGIDRMIEAMGEAGLGMPEFGARSHAFTITLRNARGPARLVAGAGVQDERRRRILQVAAQGARVSNSDLRRAIRGVSAETLRADCEALVGEGLLHARGQKRGRYYTAGGDERD